MEDNVTSLDTLVDSTLENNQNQVETTLEKHHDEKHEEEQKPTSRYQDNAAELNLKNLRLIAEREALRAQQAEERLKELERQRSSHEDDDLDSDEIMDKKEFKKYYKKINEKNESQAKETERLRQELQYYQNIATEEILKNKFKGFATIVNEKNLARLKDEDPVLFKSIMANETLIDRGEAAYKILKNHLNETKNYEEQNARLEENKLKPKSAATISGRETTANPLATYQDRKRWKPDMKY